MTDMMSYHVGTRVLREGSMAYRNGSKFSDNWIFADNYFIFYKQDESNTHVL